MSLLERCLHFRGWYVHASMELGPEDVSLLISEGGMYRLQWSWDLKMCPYQRGVLILFHRSRGGAGTLPSSLINPSPSSLITPSPSSPIHRDKQRTLQSTLVRQIHRHKGTYTFQINYLFNVINITVPLVSYILHIKLTVKL